MTDRPTTNQDLQATLATIEQSLGNMDIRANMPDIENQLGLMLDAAEASGNQTAIDAIADAWHRIQLMAEQGTAYKEAALTGIDLAKTFQNQRDNVLKELKELTEAVENIDNDHPLVSDLVQAVEEGVYEWQAVVGDDSYGEGQYDQEQEYRFALYKLTDLKDAANYFFDVLGGDREFTPEQISALKDLLKSFPPAPMSDTFGPEADDPDWDDDEDGDDDE